MASINNKSQEIACVRGSTINTAQTNEKQQTKEAQSGNNVHRSATKRKESSVVTPRQKAPIQCATSTLYVSNLHPRVTETHLELLFKSCGEITRVYFVRRRNECTNGVGNVTTQASLQVGYAFVEYKSIDSAKLAIEKVDGRRLLGKFLVVRPAHNRKQTEGVSASSNGKVCDVINSGDIKLIKKQKYDVENKIEAVKRAIEDARKKRRVK